MFVGSDTEQLRSAATKFQGFAGDLDLLRGTMGRTANALDWQGQDRDVFVGRVADVLLAATSLASLLDRAGRTLLDNATSQEAVSATLTPGQASTHTGPAPIGPDRFNDLDCDNVGRDVVLRRDRQREYQQDLARLGDDAVRKQLGPERAEIYFRLRTTVLDELGLENDAAPERDGLELLERAMHMSDFDVDVLGYFIDEGVSDKQLADILRGGHVVIKDDGALYDRLNHYSGRNDRTGWGENSHHRDERLEGTKVFGYDTPLLGESLYGRLDDGSTWFQLERHSLDVHDGDFFDHGGDYKAYKDSGLSQGPWGESKTTDSDPLRIPPEDVISY